MPLFTFDLNRPAVSFYEALHDREAEPAALKLSAQALGLLLKGLKNLCLRRLSDPDPSILEIAIFRLHFCSYPST